MVAGMAGSPKQKGARMIPLVVINDDKIVVSIEGHGAQTSTSTPEYGTPEYEALSPAGKEFADTAGQPDSAWDHGFHLKENKSA
jgi:hypothetical protein